MKDISNLEAEIETARKLLAIATASGQMTAATNLLSVLAKLTNCYDMQRHRNGELLDRDAILRLGTEIGTVLANVLRERGIPDFESIVDEVTNAIVNSVDGATNLPRLEHG